MCHDKELSITVTNQPIIAHLISSRISCCTQLMKGIPIRENRESIGNGKCYDSHIHFGNHSFIMSILSFFTVHTSYFAKGDQSPRWHRLLGNSNAFSYPYFFFYYNSCSFQDKELSITETNQPTITPLICSWISCCTQLMKDIPIR